MADAIPTGKVCMDKPSNHSTERRVLPPNETKSIHIPMNIVLLSTESILLLLSNWQAIWD
jgi:hypothetical protein